MNSYTKHEDPGHGWLQVPMAELEALNIREKISYYSYTDGTYAYLEEDCDMGVFLEAKNGGVMPETWQDVERIVHIDRLHTDNESHIRRMRRMK